MQGASFVFYLSEYPAHCCTALVSFWDKAVLVSSVSGNFSASSWSWVSFFYHVCQAEVSGAAQQVTWRWQNERFPSPHALCFDCVTLWHPTGPFPSLVSVPRLAELNALFPAAFRITKSSQQFFRFPAFSKSFTKHFALISPLRRNGELPPHTNIFCVFGVCPVTSYTKNLSQTVFWCFPSL